MTSRRQHSLEILDAIDAAVRAGFSVSFRPSDGAAVAVEVAPVCIRVGEASERVPGHTVVRRELRDAAGNALASVMLELWEDRSARAALVAKMAEGDAAAAE